MYLVLTLVLSRRTPPGVRELKLRDHIRTSDLHEGRTPPGVRELKHECTTYLHAFADVAPLPGCVN